MDNKNQSSTLETEVTGRRIVTVPRASRIHPAGIAMILALAALFVLPVYRWVAFALQNELFSYTLLIPIIATYLLYTGQKYAPVNPSIPSRRAGYLLTAAGFATISFYFLQQSAGSPLSAQDSVSLSIFALVQVVAGVGLLYLNYSCTRVSLFPFGFLIFMVPFPSALEHGLEGFLQRGSVPPAHWLFQVAGTPVYHDNLIFQLPNITLQVAPECSGIRSTVVLFITSILAGHLFLRSGWRRWALAGFVIPLALVRNGLRIFTIGELCVNVGPHMIDSFIHHRGGPIFFALSLIPFLTAMYLLIRSERSSLHKYKAAN